jgi:demethoxyubiquinone hydroxylase (CLK1/Coq7/Cat5 family)
MAVEERHHGALLRSRYAERYGTVSCALTEEDLVEFIEVPRLEDGDLLDTGSAADHSVRDRALEVALQAELGAQRFYAKLTENTTEASLRRLYMELAHMEDGHVAYLESKLAGDPLNRQNIN